MLLAPPSVQASRWWIAFVLSFGPTVSNSFARFAYALVLPAMREDLAIDWSQAGTLGTTNAIGYLLGAVLARAVVRRIGNRRIFAAGMVLTALALLATGLSRDLALLNIWRLIAGVGGAWVFICGGALSGNIFPGEPQRATTTIAIYFAGGGFGLVLCGLTLPGLLEAKGVQAWPLAWQAMGIAALLMALASILAAWRIEEPGQSPALASSGSGPQGSALRLLPAQACAYACFGLGYIGYMTFVVAWVRAHDGSTALVMTLWCALGLATLAAPRLWAGPCERWLGGRPMAAVMATLATAALLPLLSVSPMAMVLSAILFGASMFSAPSAVSSLIKHALPKSHWGEAMASFTVVFGLSQIVGPVAIGEVADLTGSLRPGLLVSGLVLAAGALIALAQRPVAKQAG
jgi:MFS family permease